MRTRLTLRPGQNGTKKLLAQYDEKLVCVRYHYDVDQGKRIKTVELIVEETEWSPRTLPARKPEDRVGVRIRFDEEELRMRVKALGAIWRPRYRLWEMSWRSVQLLGIEGRLVDG